ncbi:zinc-binding dehydrogenase [Nonomuraea jabiensis]|uniref:NADPH:quinone reductase-like Zn-dependent oxidoreductase n=1 Tax=Nonomuraea jabiensis TaxID=882448 RepID=A0A7W9LGK5_9ACTN|nr:zinc-binding dehydrogenase [Nonomuraea jabiensis]MBB5782980.1 NADPH:quinone reductase-like Zn-dependent oxidoreductase [Nonomuraea jabiensis]
MAEPVEHRRIVVERFGGPGALRLADAVAPVPGPGQARVRVLAAGVGHTDVMARRGEYLFQRRTPFTPGYEIVGEVVDQGPATGPDRLVPGTRVAACLPRMGGYTEYATLPVASLTPVPEDLDPVVAAAMPLDYLTALSLLDRHARARPGDAVLIHGAAGGVGDALCQLGRLRGLVMYGTAGDRGLDRLKSHDVIPLDYRRDDAARIIRRRHPDGVRAVFDHIGGRTMRANRRLLAPGGVLVSYAFIGRPGHVLAGTITGAAHNRLLNLLPGCRTAICSLPAEIRADPAGHRVLLGTLFDLACDGRLQPRVGTCFPLAEAAAAHRALERREVAGKIILTCAG